MIPMLLVRYEEHCPEAVKKLYVRNFPVEMDVKGLHMMFEKFGPISSAEVKRNVSCVSKSK